MWQGDVRKFRAALRHGDGHDEMFILARDKQCDLKGFEERKEFPRFTIVKNNRINMCRWHPLRRDLQWIPPGKVLFSPVILRTAFRYHLDFPVDDPILFHNRIAPAYIRMAEA